MRENREQSNSEYRHFLRSERILKWKVTLKVQSFKLYNTKYITALTEITSTEIFAFIAILVF